ncbi:hypothetical protein SH203_00722 [Brevundimonas sp. SH203]|uniref:DUF2332 domain-containing protein n=1 Tax=Brevundimonas sp. SH203 TaxID=345167 RepID=UPI0009CCC14D|nr:DUF2332 family protein [Brevundimonas sp. SH203]GAW40325.1 hypothetical protein SH203_00722 [Brevundimonas sp. SH203]
MTEAAVRQAFADQAVICTAAGAPFTGRVCRLIGERLTAEGEVGRRVLGWTGVASHQGDALPLRLMGGLHALARSGRDKALSAIYPPATAPDDEAVWSMVGRVLVEQAAFLSPWLDGPPQTNEVGRSAALMAGLLVLADRFGLPFALYELGASAGLNTVLDRYSYRLGEIEAGMVGSPVRLTPTWTGVSPPRGDVEIARRAGVDRNPLDVRDPATRARLAAYVWADQRERLARLEAALDLAAADPPPIDQADAADWLEANLSTAPETGVCRVVMHTIAYQYFSPEGQARIRARLAATGARATEDAPLAWLSFEAMSDTVDRRPTLDLTVWPGGETQRLAICQPHGAEIDWKI